MRSCKTCGRKIGRYQQYCDECREVARKKSWDRAAEVKRAKKLTNGEYKYNKNYGLEIPKLKNRKFLSPASQRWATMSWYDLTLELDYYKLRYRDAQLMAEKGTLPEDFGLKRKRRGV